MNDNSRMARDPQTPQPRAVGAPLPRGGVRPADHSAEPDTAIPPPPPRRALTGASTPSDPEAPPTNGQRVVSAIRATVPFIQRLLPLIDGNFVAAVSNMLAPQPKPPAPVNLAPLETGMAELQLQQRELRDQVEEQHTSLRRVEDHLQMVREATDRNTLEQQELMEDLKAVGHKVNLVAFAALALLLVSVLLNLFLFLHIQRILP